MQWIRIAIRITKMGAQPILEPNCNYNLNGVINLRCEWTLNVNNASCHTRTKPIVLKHFVWHTCMKCEQIDRYRYIYCGCLRSSSLHVVMLPTSINVMSFKRFLSFQFRNPDVLTVLGNYSRQVDRKRFIWMQ